MISTIFAIKCIEVFSEVVSYGTSSKAFKDKINIFNKLDINIPKKSMPLYSKFTKVVLNKEEYKKISIQDNINNIILNNLKDVLIHAKGEVPLSKKGNQSH